jgi:hypothetical protein
MFGEVKIEEVEFNKGVTSPLILIISRPQICTYDFS